MVVEDFREFESRNTLELMEIDWIREFDTMRRLLAISLLSARFLAVGMAACAQGYPPEEAVKHMTVAEGLKVTMFASEPMVRQPIFVKCDARGRLWTIQYLQYPNPAGLKRVKTDRWSRSEYDRVPEPPPHGPRGADRITILEDTDGDGRADAAKDFLEGLNLVTGVEFGYGGVFVLNVPYLLFYPDANRDDVPDSDPQVLLKGFGMEDAQSFANHLTWGPDGWLYGVNGSTTTCRIRGVEFQQGVWRYHPVTHAFELFCEGGSNCYGLTFDANGELYYSTNAGPFVHAVQGGYFYKSFGKHGPLHNLYAYHHFPELQRDAAPGSPPTGGTVYLADALPEQFCGTFVAGGFLGHTVSWWKIEPQASTVRATYGGELLNTHDSWSGPTDLCVGPDGAIYVCDFYDQRTAHPDPDANWDRSNGRIYKLAPDMRTVGKSIDVGQAASDQLVDLLSHSNHWYRMRARAELARRRDSTVANRLREMATQYDNGQLALEGLWGLNGAAHVDDALALQLLDHPYPYVRHWAVRLIGDRGQASADVGKRFASLAVQEQSAVVRAQLAASAKRLPASIGLRIVDSLLKHEPDESDPRIPWLIWWAIESKAISDRDAVVSMFAQESMWHNPAARDNVRRLIRRYAAEGTAIAYDACLKLLRSAPAAHVAAAHESLRQGLAERAVGLSSVTQGELFNQQAAQDALAPSDVVRHYEALNDELKKYVAEIWAQAPLDVAHLELALRAGTDEAYPVLKSKAFRPNLKDDERARLFGLLREFGRSDVVFDLLMFVASDQSDAAKSAALGVLSAHGNSEVASALMDAYAGASTALQLQIRAVLFARPAWAKAFLERIDAGELPPVEVPIEQLRPLALHRNAAIDALVRKHWGNIGPGTPEEKLATMRRFNNDLRAAAGDPRNGEELYTKHCGTCHQLHGKGNKIGPDLTTANRSDRAALLANIVDPSAVIRREFQNYVVVTNSGRVLTGLLAEQDAASVSILNDKNERVKISRADVEDLQEADVSLMPERILESLTSQELRDLFAYLEQTPAK
jgi:putative membrane-bound dehydrogenase-like protein